MVALAGAPNRGARVPGLQQALLAVAEDKPRSALARIDPMASQYPEHPKFQAVYGTALIMVGIFAEGLDALTFADSATLPRLQEVARADALRGLGFGAEAARSRIPLLYDKNEDRRAEWTATRAVIDALEAGDIGLAEEALYLGYSARPAAPTLLCAEAEIRMSEGDYETANLLLALAERTQQRKSAHRAVATLRWLVETGDIEGALAWSEGFRGEVITDERFAGWRARVWRLSGDPQAALEILRARIWTWRGRVNHPLHRYEEIAALLALGEREEAETRLADAWAELPHHPLTAAAHRLVYPTEGVPEAPG